MKFRNNPELKPMKNLRFQLGVVAAAMLLALSLGTARGADGTPPGKMTYQGFLTDINGTPLGNTSPVNQTVIFRVYSAATGGTLKWSEQQTVTIDKGHFSILLGEGSAVGSEPGNATVPLRTLFVGADASDRFIEMTVAGTVIAPRLQFFPSPYSYLARYANQVVDGAGASVLSANNGTVSLPIVSGDVSVQNGGKVGIGTATLTKTLNVGDLGLDNEAMIRLSSKLSTSFRSWDIGVATTGVNAFGFVINDPADSANPTKLAIKWGSGFTGIGTANPTSKLHVIGNELIEGSTFYLHNGVVGGYTWNHNGTNKNYLKLDSGNDGIYFDSGLAHKAHLTAGGRLGVNMVDPRSTLHVNGGGSFGNVANDLAGLAEHGKVLRLGFREDLDSAMIDSYNWATAAYKNLLLTPYGNGKVGINAHSANLGRALQIGDSVYNTEGMIRLLSKNGTASRVWDIGVPATDPAAGTTNFSFIINDTQRAGTRFIIKYINGYAGINNDDPQHQLDVGGTIKATGEIIATSKLRGDALELAANAKFWRSANGDGAYAVVDGGAGGLYFRTLNDTGASVLGQMRFIGGKLGIGTESPRAPLEVQSSGAFSTTAGYRKFNYSDGATGPQSFGTTIETAPTILSGGNVAAPAVIVFSDKRIKDNVVGSDGAQDLAEVRKLRVADYDYVDQVAHGNKRAKGFIAQEVEKVMPEAVNSTRNFIPNIYALAESYAYDTESKQLSITLGKAHSLAVGDSLKLYVDDAPVSAKVESIESDRQVSVSGCTAQPKSLFVYGQEVSDFKTINYDRVFTSGIGAIQELARRVESIEAREKNLAELEAKAARVDQLEQDVDELKRLVASLAARQDKDRQVVNRSEQSVTRIAKR